MTVNRRQELVLLENQATHIGFETSSPMKAALGVCIKEYTLRV